MSALDVIIGGFWRWLDQVAEQTVALVSRYKTKPAARLVEGDYGHFALSPSGKREGANLAGTELNVEDGTIAVGAARKIEAALRDRDIELVLRSDRFVLKPLELPSRATEFLDGVVRAQIDRLTPWRPDQAAFGFSAPAEARPGRIVVTVAATAKAMLLPLANAFRPLGAHSVTMRTALPEEPTAPAITVLKQNTARILDVGATRRILSHRPGLRAPAFNDGFNRRRNHRRPSAGAPRRARARDCAAARRDIRRAQHSRRSENHCGRRAGAPQEQIAIGGDRAGNPLANSAR